VNKVFDIFAGMGILIGIYLFLANGKQSVAIINSIAGNTTQGIKVLQGR